MGWLENPINFGLTLYIEDLTVLNGLILCQLVLFSDVEHGLWVALHERHEFSPLSPLPFHFFVEDFPLGRLRRIGLIQRALPPYMLCLNYYWGSLALKLIQCLLDRRDVGRNSSSIDQTYAVSSAGPL